MERRLPTDFLGNSGYIQIYVQHKPTKNEIVIPFEQFRQVRRQVEEEGLDLKINPFGYNPDMYHVSTHLFNGALVTYNELKVPRTEFIHGDVITIIGEHADTVEKTAAALGLPLHNEKSGDLLTAMWRALFSR